MTNLKVLTGINCGDGKWKYGERMFHIFILFCWIFYCLSCQIVPLITQLSKLLIVLFPPVHKFQASLTSKNTELPVLTKLPSIP